MVGGKCNAGISIGGGQGSVGKHAALLAARKQVYNMVSQSTTMMEAEATNVFNAQAQNIHNCKENLKQNQRDLELVKDSITTVEVRLL